jgi:hypothetical protein
MKTTKVKTVQGAGNFESKYGAEQTDGKKLLFTYDYEFEDGTFLQANHKSVPAPFKVGDEVEYEVTRESEQYGKSGKVSRVDMSVYARPTPNQTQDNLKGIKIGHAITNAVQLYCSLPVSDRYGAPNGRLIELAKMILKIGEELNNENVKEAPQEEQNIPF